jgi:flagellar M-ring protein FliF
VTRMSIAVLLDSSKKLKPADAASLKKLVSAAAGLQTKRGDSLELGQLTFDTAGAKQAANELALVGASEQKMAMFDLIKSVLLGLLALATVLIAYRGAKKSSARFVSPIPLDSLPRSTVIALPPAEVVEDNEPELVAPAEAVALPSAPRPDLAGLIDRQPDEVTSTLRDWLADRRS